MLQLVIPLTAEGWDAEKEEFVPPKTVTLSLEHSLVSISKWESKYCKPFLSTKDMTAEETLDYIKFMTLTKNVNPDVYNHLTPANIKEVTAYISAPMTATTVTDRKTSKRSREVVTSELIYYWMIALGIPMECQKWHLNRLIMLVRVCNAKNNPGKKPSQRDLLSQYAALNAARKKQLNTTG